MASNGEGSPLSSPLPDDVDGENMCNLCNQKYCQPRILSCLHVFCEQCLNKLLLENTEETNGGPISNVISCPDCNQETKVSKHGAASLHSYYLCSSPVGSNAADTQPIVCTSCKSKTIAEAHCSDCDNFLCPSCVTAHKYMRCFENHKVEPIQALKGIDLCNSLNCPSHPNETLKYFCLTCEFPVCNECLINDHKLPEHQCDSIGEVEKKQREELRNLMAESKSKVQFCEEASGNLENLLSELQLQHDNARSHIIEAFQSYKAYLEKIMEDKLRELESSHKTQELKVMETYHCVDKTIEKIEDACKFTTRLLEKGSTTEILLLKGLVGSQLLYLINNTPKPDVSICLEFETDQEQFKCAVKEYFGTFKKGEPTKDDPVQLSSLHSSFDSEPFVLPSSVLGTDDPTSVQPNVDLPTSTFSDFTLSQLATLAADMHHQPPASPLSLADIISTPDSLVNTSNINAINNLTALAKLGSAQGQLLLNGNVMSGLNLDGSIQTRSSASASPTNHLQTASLSSALDAATALGALFNGGLPSPHGISSRGQSPHLDGNCLLNGTATNQMNGHLTSVLSNSLLGNSDLIQNLTGQGGYPLPRSAAAKLNPVKIRYKFGQLGPGKGQFSSPHGFCLGPDEEIVVADTNNHRIQVFDKAGDFKYQFGIPGKEEGQLWYPRKVAVMRNSGKFVVCDRGNERSRMQIFTKNGHFIKKIAIRYIDIVAGLAITNQGYIVAVDSVSPTVFIIAESGDLLRWFDCSDYMREPSDIAISGKEYFVCDFKGHCVVVFNEDGQFVRRIGCENITNYPNGIDISDAGDVLVGDSHGNRFHVAVFTRDGSLLSEFECPYVKVSRCCGLKITSEGYVVTLAKNNHHVLILNTLYIQ